MRLPLVTRPRSHVGLDTHDRLQAVRGGLATEANCAKQVPVVGHGDRRLTVRSRTSAHLVDFLRAVEQRIGRVVVQVNEAGRRIGHFPSPSSYSHSIVPGGLLVMS